MYSVYCHISPFHPGIGTYRNMILLSLVCINENAYKIFKD